MVRHREQKSPEWPSAYSASPSELFVSCVELYNVPVQLCSHCDPDLQAETETSDAFFLEWAPLCIMPCLQPARPKGSVRVSAGE